MKRLLMISLALALTGCMAPPRSVKGLSEEQSQVNEIWQRNVKECVDSADRLDKHSSSSNAAKLGIAVLGTLSGSVFSQLAKGSGKDAWSGLSGSTNALQSALDNTFSANLMLREAMAIAAAVVASSEALSKESNIFNQLQIANRLPMTCRLARLKAIDDANRAMTHSDSDLDKKVDEILAAVKNNAAQSPPTTSSSDVTAPTTSVDER